MSQSFFRKYLLAALCIVAPLLFSFLAGRLAVEVTQDAVETIALEYRFFSHQELKAAEADPTMLLQALDLRGRIRYAAVSAVLWFVCVSACWFGRATVVERCGRVWAVVAAAAFLIVAYILTLQSDIVQQLRPLMVERVLRAAVAQNVQILPTEGGRLEKIFQVLFRHIDHGPGATMVTLVRLNVMVGVFSVGMLLAALASASVRPGGPAPRRDKALKQLKERRRIIGVALAFGSAVLVLAVITNKFLTDWPTSMLIDSQRKAIAPINDALSLQFGLSCTLALIGAVTPALYALYLDRNENIEARRARPARVRVARRKQPPGNTAEEEIGFWSWASAGGVIAVLAPVLTPAIVDLLKNIIGTLSTITGHGASAG